MIHPPTVVLTTLNAKYIHASLGLRCLLANMGELRSRTVLREFTVARPAPEIVDELLGAADGPAPQIIGFGVYIWNVVQTTAVLSLLRAARPDIKLVLGGPEVSHEVAEQEITGLADHVITGWGDLSFAKLCRALLAGPRPLSKVIAGEQPPLDQLALPYGEYSAADLAHRLLYVEASRGCPFKCEFCLSALDQTAWAFDLERFLAAMDELHRRGARHFKFVDRTFNLKIDTSLRILQFFLDRLSDDLFLHFEVVPDHLPERLKAMIVRFPPGVLQFEIGIQSFNPEVQQRISRRQDNAKAEANLRWLVEHANAHLHADLIFGLPGETLASFAAGFDRLYRLRPHEIQLGILKRLRGTPIARHSVEHGMIYDPAPPYTVRQTAVVDAETMRRFARFARYWDLLANSGRFRQTLPLLLDAASPEPGRSPSPFRAFLDFADWLWQSTGQTSGLSPEALVDALFDYLCKQCVLPTPQITAALLADYVASGARGSPQTLRGLLPPRAAPGRPERQLVQRQAQHRA
ncbi:MAG: DUF4080 domain-containing protein [Dechloromonas sp.]|nr:DUF4080 domain-containing protein [Dechloromonas sp.]